MICKQHFRRWRVIIWMILLVPALMIIKNKMASTYHHVHRAQPHVKKSVVQGPKWIVIVTDDVRAIETYRPHTDWNIVIIGKQHVTAKNVVCLNADKLRDIGFKTGDLLLHGNRASRKNIGYLFAILHGAKFIYDVSDSLELRVKVTIPPPRVGKGLVFAGKDYFNAFKHYGYNTIWSRGFPAEVAPGTIDSPPQYVLQKVKVPLIQQLMINKVPDVDPVSIADHMNQELTLDHRLPPVFLPRDVFTPINSLNTVFLYDAFWALVLPQSVSADVADIWRGYWAQRLLWEIGGTVGIFPPNGARNVITSTRIDNSVLQQTEDLIRFLRQWTCPDIFSFFTCVIDLTKELVRMNFWDISDLDLIKAWLLDLKSLDYKEPNRKTASKNVTSIFKNLMSKPASWYKDPRLDKAILFYPEHQPILDSSVVSSWNTQTSIAQLCPELTISYLEKMPKRFPNILLVVLFNWPFYDNIIILEKLHRVHFSHIVYCGNNASKMEKDIGPLAHKITFIKTHVDEGIVGYNCLSHAINMNYDVDGYIFTGDDVLLNSWNLHKAPLDKIWFHKSISKFNISDNTIQNRWVWWNRPSGKKSYVNVLKSLTKIYKVDKRTKKLVSDFRRMVKVNAHGGGDIFRSYADILYIPRKYKHKMLFFMEIYGHDNVMLELALPTILSGLDHHSNIHRITMVILWHAKRKQYAEYFNPKTHFMHPFKIMKQTKTKDGLSFMCKEFIPRLLEIKS